MVPSRLRQCIGKRPAGFGSAVPQRLQFAGFDQRDGHHHNRRERHVLDSVRKGGYRNTEQNADAVVDRNVVLRDLCADGVRLADARQLHGQHTVVLRLPDNAASLCYGAGDMAYKFKSPTARQFGNVTRLPACSGRMSAVSMNSSMPKSFSCLVESSNGSDMPSVAMMIEPGRRIIR